MDSPSTYIDLRIDGKKSTKKPQNLDHHPKPPPPTTTLVDFPPLPPSKSASPSKETQKTTILIGALALSTQPHNPSVAAAQTLKAPPSTAPRDAAHQVPNAVPSDSRKPHTSAPSAAPGDRPSDRTAPPGQAHSVLLNTTPSISPTPFLAATGTSPRHVGAAVPAVPMEDSNIVKAFKGQFDYKPRHAIQGIPCLSFKEFDKSYLLSKIKHIIVVKFSHSRPKYVDFRSFLVNQKFEKSYKFVEFDKKHVFVEFESFHDFAKFWIKRSVMINGFKDRLFCWDGNFSPYVESFLAPVWIHLPGLPLFMFDEEVVLSIGALFWKTLFIDPACLNKDNIGVLSFCVSMDVREKELVEFWVEFVGEGIHVTRFLQRVVYGDIPPYCSSCKHLGHSTESCKVLEAVDLREKLDGKKVMQEVHGNDRIIPTVSVFKRLGVLSVPTKGKDLGESSTVIGRILEEGEVEDITNEEEFDFENRNSATFAVQEPSLEPHNLLCGNNGVQAFGVLDRGVGNLQFSSKFEAIAVVEEEIIAVENEVLQKNSANCVECATLNEDFSLLEQDMQVIPGSNDSLLENLKVTEESLVKSQKGCSETEFENREKLQSAADSVKEATLQEDISQLKQDMQVIPTSLDSIHGTLQVAEGSLAISQKGCPESELENGKLVQTDAESVKETTLRGHISTSRDFQPLALGVPDSPVEDLQREAELDLIAQEMEEKSDSENGGSSENAAESSTLNEHNFCSERDTEMIFDVPESQEDHLFETPILDINSTTGSVFVWLAKKVFERVRDRLYPPDFRGISLDFAKKVLEKVCIIQGTYLSHADPLDKGVKQVQNMLVNKLSPRKVVITHPITREVINLASPSRSQSSMSSQASTIPVSSKTQQNQIKKARKKAKKQRLAEKKIAQLVDMSTPQLKELAKKIIPERSYEKVLCKVNLQDWSGLDCNRSKDSAFWQNYHGAVREMGDEDYPFMFRSDDSEEVDIESATPKRYYEPP